MSLKAHRLNLGLSVEEFARKVNAKPTSVYYWERTGGRPRDASVAKHVADFLHVAVTDLWPVEPPEKRAA